jgi:hypothetical protein
MAAGSLKNRKVIAMKKSTMKKIWIVALALMAFGAMFETVKTARAEDTPTKPPGRR